MVDITLDKKHTALLIGDYYEETMETLPHAVSRDCLKKTQALQKAARQAGIFICYSATVFRPGHIEISERNKVFNQRKHSGRPAIADPLAVLHPAIKPIDGEAVVSKHRVGALYGTDLAMILGANNIDTLIILGYATSGVVLSTTRHAADADYRLFIVEDCCTDPDPAIHDFLCQKLFPRQADVVQSTDVIRALTE